jgi:hypothetical protein
MKNARLFALTASLGSVLALPAASHATVTIGSDLGDAPSVGIGCIGSGCTRVQTSLPADDLAPNGVSSPVNGTVVTWRIRSTASATQQPIAFRVISPAAGGQFTGGGSSATVTPPDITGVTPFAASIPIKIGDLLGVNYGNGTNEYFGISAGPNSGQLFNPILASGSTRSPQNNTTEQLLVNADIEPTNTFTATAKGKKGGKVKISAQLPNAGTFQVGDKKDLASVAAKRRLTGSSVQLTAPGTADLKVKATKSARALLASKGKLYAKLKLVFTPLGGTASSQVIRVKLKP